MISVIIPSYNRAATIRQAAESVLNQTYKDIELIIVDDCSNDNTEEVVASLQDDRVRYVRHERNQGACAARNTGIEVARGEYIAFQDSDDAWYQEKLERQLQKLKETGADIVFCKLVRHSWDGTITRIPEDMKEGFLKPVKNLFGIGTQTLLARSAVFKEYRFDVEMPRFQEMELLLRATQKYSIYCMEDALVDYYLNEQSITANPLRLIGACQRILEKYPDIRETHPEIARIMSNKLFSDANGISVEQKSVYRKMNALGLKINKTPKNLVKYLAAVTGIRRLYHKWRKSC